MTRLFAISSTLLCLTLCASCSTVRTATVVDTKIVRDRVPSALLTPCAKPKRQPAAKTVGVIVSRLQYTESALRECGAKVDGVRAWDATRG